MIKIEGLGKSFGKTEVLKDININIKEGEIYGLIGHSGAGKSTLLRCINGLESYDTGSVTVMGKEVKDLSESELRSFRKNLGMIFQNFNLLKRKTVFDNVALPLEVWKYHEPKLDKDGKDTKSGKNKEDINKRVMKLLKLVGLEDKAKSKPSQLSGGQKQRVAIARALALDPKITKDILALLSKINKELGITIVIVTHQMEVIKEVCERVALLDGGKIQVEGKAEDLFLKPGSSLKKFLGEEEDTTLPNEGVNIRIFFPADCSENAIITKMAREANIDCSIVSGKLEKFRDNVLGSLVINIEKEDKNIVEKYLKDKDFEWEVI